MGNCLSCIKDNFSSCLTKQKYKDMTLSEIVNNIENLHKNDLEKLLKHVKNLNNNNNCC